MKDDNQSMLAAIEKTFAGSFLRSSFLNSTTLSLIGENDTPVALFTINGKFLLRSVFYNETVFNTCMPNIHYTKEENTLLKKAYTAFCLNDALVNMIKTKGSFNLKEIFQLNESKSEYTFYNSCTLTEIELFHEVSRHAFYYSYDKHMIMDNAGVFHPVLLLDVFLKQKRYSIYLSPELNKTANIETFSGNNSDRFLLTFEQLFENGMEIADLNKAIDDLWTYDIFFNYVDALLKNRPLVDSMFDSFSNCKDMMSLVEMHLI